MIDVGLCAEIICLLVKLLSGLKKLFTSQKPSGNNSNNSGVIVQGNNNIINIMNPADIKDTTIEKSFKIATSSTPLWLYCDTNGGHFALGEYFFCEALGHKISLWIGIQSDKTTKETKVTKVTLHFWNIVNDSWEPLPETCGFKKDAITNSSFVVIDDLLDKPPEAAFECIQGFLNKVLNAL